MLSLSVLLLACVQASQGSDELLVSSFFSSSVTRFDASNGNFELAYGPGPLAGSLGITIGPDGALYACSETSNEVLRYDPLSGAYLGAFVRDDPATMQDESGGLAGPSGIVFGTDGMAYVASFNSDAVLRYDWPSGTFDSVFVQPGAGGLNGPDAGLAFGPGGELLVPSYWSNQVKRYDGSSGAFVGDFTTFQISGLLRPRTVLFDGAGQVYVTSEGSNEVLSYDESGTFLGALVTDDIMTPVDESGGLNGPTGIGLGPDGRLYVASIGTDEVLRYETASGLFVDAFVTAGSGGIDAPTFLAFRPRTGNYCNGGVNSIGKVGVITAAGFTSVSAGQFELRASSCTPGEPGVFFHGMGKALLPAGMGTLCIAGPQLRLPPVVTNTAGLATVSVSLGAAGIVAGSTRHFQFWYRDAASFNFTDAVRATFSP